MTIGTEFGSFKIGKARRIEILVLEGSIRWEDFIIITEEINGRIGDRSRDFGPLRLAEQLKQKYSDRHSLVRLLKTHQKALCQDPRDKAYRFIGLATYCYKFPLDYGKSTYKVWEDTVWYESNHDLMSSDKTVEFAKFVKGQLGGDDIATTDQALNRIRSRPYGDRICVAGYDGQLRIVKIAGFYIGSVSTVGPSPEEFISDLSKTDDWTRNLQSNFKSRLGSANQENDRLLQKLEKCKDDHLALLSVSLESYPWRHRNNFEATKLFQMSEAIDEIVDWKMGVGPGNVLKSDQVYLIPGLKIAVVMRSAEKARWVKMEGGGETLINEVGWETVGSAIFALFIGTDRVIDGIPKAKNLEIDLAMDVGVAYALISE
jgi:hypothetical protein